MKIEYRLGKLKFVAEVANDNDAWRLTSILADGYPLAIIHRVVEQGPPKPASFDAFHNVVAILLNNAYQIPAFSTPPDSAWAHYWYWMGEVYPDHPELRWPRDGREVQ